MNEKSKHTNVSDSKTTKHKQQHRLVRFVDVTNSLRMAFHQTMSTNCQENDYQLFSNMLQTVSKN